MPARSILPARLAVVALVLLGTRACLIHPEKDYPVRAIGPSPIADGGESGDGGSSTRHPGGGAANPSGDAGAAGDPLPIAGDGGSPSQASAIPTSCAAARSDGLATDGVVLVDPDGSGPIKPFEVYCFGMNSTEPKEFLELPHTDATGFPKMNTSTYGTIGSDSCPCTGPVTSSFSKVRLRLSDLTILVKDRTFATFVGDTSCLSSAPQGACDHMYLGYATAADCAGAGTSGTAEIDLGDTPFHVAPAADFAPFGYQGGGKAAPSNNRKRIGVVGGGFCGGFSPVDPTYSEGWQTGGELALEQD